MWSKAHLSLDAEQTMIIQSQESKQSKWLMLRMRHNEEYSRAEVNHRLIS